MDMLEEVMPSAEEKEIEKEVEEANDAAGGDDAADEEVKEEEEAAGKDDAADEVKDEEEGDGKEQGGADEPKDKAIPQAAKKTAKTIPWLVKTREKRPDECLNLNNEVVRMRKEVKRVRALIIRKLTRQIGVLKKKKGKELEVESNQRRAGRLLEEIHAMKTLSTDLVSKAALQKNLNFDQVCKDPKSTVSDRATARIATHPQFSKKIQDIKAAVKAFKEERMKGGKRGGKEKVQIKDGKVNTPLLDKQGEREKERGVTVEQKEIADKEKDDELLKDSEDATVAKPEEETGKASPAVGQRKEMPEARNLRSASVKGSEVKDVVKNKPQVRQAAKKPDLKSAPEALQKKMDEEEESDLESDGEEKDKPQAAKKPDMKSAPEVLQKKMDEEEESDLESDGEEKEYFDDSTEERFHKKSSQSEGSDDDDGFFVGKVRKFNKKKKKSAEEGTASKGQEGTSSDKVQGELDELESRLKSKATSLQSVFFSSLSSSRPGGGRGRGGDGFRGRGRPDRDFSKQPKLQKQERERESFPSGGRGRGRGRGRGSGTRQNDRRGGGGGGFSQQPPEQALHPSWEASKKRKEQQGQILAFQGKKIKFDMDD